MKKSVGLVLGCVCGLLMLVGGTVSIEDTVQALPFNDDMVHNQLKPGMVVRPPVPGTVAKGDLYIENVESKEDALNLKNPKKADALSVERGKRLFAVNCYSCHGIPRKEGWQPGPVGKYLPGPNLADALYDTDDSDGSSRSDGNIFGTIYFGNLIMPRVGWKLRSTEAWDVINYIRSVQNK